MADKTSDQKPKESAQREEPSLQDGASSHDPAVHQLLAERQTAAMNGNREAADAATARLAELGYK